MDEKDQRRERPVAGLRNDGARRGNRLRIYRQASPVVKRTPRNLQNKNEISKLIWSPDRWPDFNGGTYGLPCTVQVHFSGDFPLFFTKKVFFFIFLKNNKKLFFSTY